MLLTETWVHDSVADSELIDTDAFAVFRRGRGSGGDGVLLAFPASAHVTRRMNLEHHALEVFCGAGPVPQHNCGMLRLLPAIDARE